MVVLSAPELIADLRKARDEDLSAEHGFGAVRTNICARPYSLLTEIGSPLR